MAKIPEERMFLKADNLVFLTRPVWVAMTRYSLVSEAKSLLVLRMA